jgi:pyruvate/oxaloacetate carboxyltransferase
MMDVAELPPVYKLDAWKARAKPLFKIEIDLVAAKDVVP